MYKYLYEEHDFTAYIVDDTQCMPMLGLLRFTPTAGATQSHDMMNGCISTTDQVIHVYIRRYVYIICILILLFSDSTTAILLWEM